MKRINDTDLNMQVRRLNKLMGLSAKVSYNTVGSYVIDGAYGGVSLYKIETESGGVSDVFRCGHIPKRDLYNRLCAFIDGIELILVR